MEYGRQMLEQRIFSPRTRDRIIVEPRPSSVHLTGGVAETVLDRSSEGACLVDVFSFPRAGTAPRQVSECITPDGNHGAVKSLLCWLLAPGS